jgi:hypothetical protein
MQSQSLALSPLQSDFSIHQWSYLQVPYFWHRVELKALLSISLGWQGL